MTAKLRVLQLEPIKNRLGDKWPRLSALVHTLFERALKRTQGPSDRFIKVGELSYVATFRGQSLEEASIMCAAVAKQVCEQLFGDELEEISVRNLIGAVSSAAFDVSSCGEEISTILEEHGRETIVTHCGTSKRSGMRALNSAGMRAAGWDESQVSSAHAMTGLYNISVGFYPVWDLQKGKSNSLYLAPYTNCIEQRTASLRRLLTNTEERQILDVEIALLFAAAEYAGRVSEARKLCAIAVGVSYETLLVLKSRTGYIDSLKSIHTHPSCPLLLKIEQVPDGVPLGKVAELAAMLVVPNLRILIEFQTGRALP